MLKNIFLILLSVILLQSCASPKMSQEMEGGRSKFLDGNYKEAFHIILPLAANGKKEAQYAVGYMYYYGLGVPRDSESGIFWMQKSAEQNYQPAKDALNLIYSRDGVRVP